MSSWPRSGSIFGVVVDVETPHGLARAQLRHADEPIGALVLGHGAGAGIDARDLVAVAEAAVAAGVSVALVEQPYRVAGRRAPAPARQLDAAWTSVVEHLRANELRGLQLVVGGRSLGACLRPSRSSSPLSFAYRRHPA
jgi:predicted alpha/beta-hydrolase family hydrolase